MTPEEKARQNIDKKLEQAGWIVQKREEFNPGAGIGIAVREFPTDTGPADYILFVDREPVGVIEAKKEGTILSQAEDQSFRYATSGLKWSLEKKVLPYIYESTGVITRFSNLHDPNPRSREVFHFHRPETFQKWLNQKKSLRARLKDNIPELKNESLRKCQYNAIIDLEKSFAENRPRALVQMATGSGKTFASITSVYRILKFADAKRILFLVDTKNLGEQAQQEFQAYTPVDDNRKFTELYNVQRLSSRFIDKDSQVCISTIQRMYSILKGEDLEESAEEISLNEIRLKDDKPKEVVYNPAIPIEFFDFIIIDECHRSIYNLWKQVLDYFDAFFIGLTATPDNRTFGFFNENVVSEYSHEEAVADGVNVGYDIYTIETDITKHGAELKADQYVDFRSKLTRQKRWTQLDEDFVYSGKQLDKDIVNKSQIRRIVQTFRDKLKSEIFPDRNEVPKTLIFAKTDSHADDIIQIVREEFAEGNAFCKKITYNSDEDPKFILAQFRNAYNPRIAVTVDMIATGTDVRPIECLLFMRDVKSRNYFEQMKGRGTRVLQKDDLRKVSPSAISNKTHFVIIDAVGVCKSVKTDSRALERKKTASLKDLMMNVVMGQKDEDTLTSLANRLTRLEKQINDDERNKFVEITNGKSINNMVHELLDAYNPDKSINKARQKHNIPEDKNPSDEQIKDIQKELKDEACKVFDDPDLRDYIENVRKGYDQIIDTINIDRLDFAGFEKQSEEKAENTVQDFQAFIEENKDKITALKIFYDQPYRRRELTYQIIKELRDTLIANKPNLSVYGVWEAYKKLENKQIKNPVTELTALVALVRRVVGLDKELTTFESIVNRNFKDWVFKKNAGNVQFAEEQMEWLRMIKDHIITSMHLDKEDFDRTPFAGKGGLMKVWKLFGDELDEVINELNEVLVA